MEAVYYVSVLLLVVSMLALPVLVVLFLVRPHLLNNRRYIKKPFSRRKILLVGVLAFVTSFIGFGSVMAATEPASVKEARVQAENGAAQKAAPKPQQNEEAQKVELVETVTKMEEEAEDIPFGTVEEETSSLAKGVKTTKVEGAVGKKITYYEVTYVDGKETTRVKKESKVTKEPVDKVVTVGTYVKPASKPKPSTSTAPKKSSCNPNYSGCVPNVAYDLNCADIGQKVRVLGYDQYRLDADDDGWGCDSY